jgi:hypothetical protein
MILSIGDSPRKGKRFRVIYKYENGVEKAFDFSVPNANTYIDGASEKTRDAYRRRHLSNPNERMKIENFIPSPALFSFWITWGETRSISKNVKILNGLME